MTTSIGRNSGSTATPTKATFSYWLKGKEDGTAQGIWGWHRGNDAGNYWLGVYYSTNGSMYVNWKQGSFTCTLGTTQKFRDPSAWAHHVISIDTTLSTAADRIKWYINGERVTSFEDGLDTITQNSTILNWSNSNDKIEIGTWYQASTAKNLNNHLLSHFHFTDGYAYQASDFGSIDSTTGQWKINTSPSVTYGNEGFFMLKDDAALTDRSGKGNNFSLGGGTLTKTEDSPSNVFPIFAGLYCPKSSTNNAAFLNGGTTVGGSPGDASSIASMGARSGKYYWEIKVQNSTNTRSCGVVRSDSIDTSHGSGIYPGGDGNATIWTVAYNMVNGWVQKNDNGTQTQQGSLATLTTGDILGVALNLTDYEIKWYKNDALVTTTSLSADWVAYGNFLLPCNRMDGNQFVQYNFGNGFFANTAVSSAGTNASGNGIFEYDVPTGFTALTTKGLNL